MFKNTLIIYGILMIAGGVMGYVKAGSQMSLIMGIVSGILIFLGVYLLHTSYEAAKILVTAVSGILTIVFMLRFLKTHAFMPAGMLLVLSFGMLSYCISQLFNKVWNP